jgi:PAS domain S-box-containing protein
MVMASREQNQSCVITMANAAACELFGYSQDSIRGRKIECLLPELYKQPHKEAIRAAATYSPRRERLMGFGLSRTSYILPLNICIGVQSRIGDPNIFMATFSKLNTSLRTCYVLTDPKYIITDVSSKANYDLALSPKLIKSRDLDLRELCPAIGKNAIIGSAFSIKNATYMSPRLDEGEIERFHITCPPENIGVPRHANLIAGLIVFHNQPLVGYYFEFRVRQSKKGLAPAPAFAAVLKMPAQETVNEQTFWEDDRPVKEEDKESQRDSQKDPEFAQEKDKHPAPFPRAATIQANVKVKTKTKTTEKTEAKGKDKKKDKNKEKEKEKEQKEEKEEEENTVRVQKEM